MTINELLGQVAALVCERETIDHGSIRMLWNAQAVRDIESAEGVDEVGIGTVGDDELSDRLNDIGDAGELEIEAVAKLWRAYLGESVEDYVDPEAEDELRRLDDLIEAAREVVS